LTATSTCRCSKRQYGWLAACSPRTRSPCGSRRWPRPTTARFSSSAPATSALGASRRSAPRRRASRLTPLQNRLLPAFDTPTGLPLHRVNLRRGALASESKETCTAAAGSLLLELGELSRLTGDPTFEAAARRAVDALWGRRSEHELVGTTVHTHTGRWLQTATGIGAGVDSFFEYLLKAYHLTGEQELLDRFDTAYAAANRHTTWRGYNVQVHMDHGSATARPTPPGGGKPHPSHRVSALQGFWPALQVLAGDVGPAERTYGKLVGVWRRFDAMPELYVF